MVIQFARFEDYEGWYCRKGYPAVNLQAAVDPYQRFISFDKRTGSGSDRKIWSASNFGQHIDEVLPPERFILGDKGYTLSNALLIPYKTYDRKLDLSSRERNYNYLICNNEKSFSHTAHHKKHKRVITPLPGPTGEIRAQCLTEETTRAGNTNAADELADCGGSDDALNELSVLTGRRLKHGKHENGVREV
ncbi:hypothetical protein PI124_g3497 [Phytophthora idaei]|nr:hypothetical protein PI125_g2861 [Phytophthora idaei]KAG3173656.1 hypothetical protein PI126_g711 [Phytophthora idaei]KAG3251878.1 hypothetical protein PI124_g3497 [Phytophthora idaei]